MNDEDELTADGRRFYAGTPEERAAMATEMIRKWLAFAGPDAMCRFRMTHRPAWMRVEAKHAELTVQTPEQARLERIPPPLQHPQQDDHEDHDQQDVDQRAANRHHKRAE